MKKSILLFFICFLMTFLLCSCCLFHETVTDEAIAPTCTTYGLTEGKHCTKCNKILVPQQKLDALGHSEELVSNALPATCTDDGYTQSIICSDCGEALVPQEKIDALGHSNALLATGISPTCTSVGATDKFKCKVCFKVTEHTVIEKLEHNYVSEKCIYCNKDLNNKIDYTDLDFFSSQEGYRYFETQENGEAMRLLYDEMKSTAFDFHNSTYKNAQPRTIHGATHYVVERFNYNNYGLTKQEAAIVKILLRKDHPILYWITFPVLIDEYNIYLSTVSEYANASERAKLNQIVYDEIDHYVSLAENETTAYNTALIYYEALIKNNDYAYNSQNEPETALWAHSIIGAFTHNKFVCEGYAKLFQLLLNISNIENKLVEGKTPEAYHVWNMVRMDNGEWFWFDVTYGETTSQSNALNYFYFCAVSSKFKNHTPAGTTLGGNMGGPRVNEQLPEVKNMRFYYKGIMALEQTIELDDNTYEICGYKTLKKKSGFSPTPAIIVYNGVVYNVINK